MDFITQDEAKVKIKEWLSLGETENSIKIRLSNLGFVNTVADNLLNEVKQTLLPPTTTLPNQNPVPLITNQNTSGMGDSSIVPAEIKGWSWGAFFWTWIWSIFNNVWIGLLCLLPIPFLAFIMSIVLGINGREWAWRNKHWDSIDQFKSTQHKWALWGLIIPIAIIIMGILSAGILVAINPQKQIERAKCITGCQKSGDPQLCIQQCQQQLQPTPTKYTP